MLSGNEWNNDKMLKFDIISCVVLIQVLLHQGPVSSLIMDDRNNEDNINSCDVS